MKKLGTGYCHKVFVSPVDGSEQRYALWVPHSYTPDKNYPLIVALHGTDADEKMIPEQCFEMPVRGFREDVIFISPFCRGDLFYRGAAEADLWAAIKAVKSEYKIDSKRHYLTGLSMGGYGTWRLGALYPQYWAAIAPICGGGEAWMAAALAKMPVWCVHGDEDEQVPVENSRYLVEALKQMNPKVRYDELSGWGHNSWEWLYDPDRTLDSLVSWFLSHRKPESARNVFVPRLQNDFWDLFRRRLIISYASGGSKKERRQNQEIAERFGKFQFGDWQMRAGQFFVKPDTALTAEEIRTDNHLLVGKPIEHAATIKFKGIDPSKKNLAMLSLKRGALKIATGPWSSNRKQTIGICCCHPGIDLATTMESLLDDTGGKQQNPLVSGWEATRP